MIKRVLAIIGVVWALSVMFGFVLGGWQFAVILLLLTGVSFLQNMSFTWVSRSRNSGDPDYHRYAAWASNGVWLLTQTFIAANVYTPISEMVKTGIDATSILKILVTFVVYAVSTTEGSVFMMKMLLGKVNIKYLSRFFAEKGTRKVGSR